MSGLWLAGLALVVLVALGAAVGAAMRGGAALLVERTRANREELLERLGARLGLPRRTQVAGRTRVGGEHAGLPVFIGHDEGGELRIEVHGAPHGIRLQREFRASRDVAVGDRAFDREVYVKGRVPRVQALLDARTREVVRALVNRRDLSLDPKGVVLLTTSEATVESDLERAVQLVRSLRGEGDSELERLERIARKDPIPRVREKALRALVTGFRKESGPILKAALNDAENKVRLVAASSLGDTDTMTAIAIHPDTRAADRRYAIRSLGQHCGRTEDPTPARRAFRYALRHGTSTVVREAAKYIARLRFEAMRPHLHTALARRTGVHKWGQLTDNQRARRRPIVEAVVDALAELGPFDDASQERVLALLDAPDPELHRIALRCLHVAGNVAAVERLLVIAEGRSLLSDLPRLARDAVTAIQARAGGERGLLQIAQVPAEAGALSVAEAEAAGRLEMVEPDREG